MKQTEIGLIPDDWEVKRLGDIYNFQYGDGNTNPNNNGAFPVYGANGIIGGYTKFNAVDSIVIGHMGEYAGSVIWASGKHFVTYNGTITKPKDEKILNPKYGYYSLLFKNINKICAGSGYPFLAYDKLNLISIPLPPLPEQQRIAKALSDVDALISTTEKLIQKKKNIKQGTMQELLTGKKRLPGFAKSNNTKMTELGEIPEDWEVKSLDEFIDDFIVPMRDKPTDLTGPIPWCRIEDFDGKYLSESKTNQGVSLETIKKMNLKIFPLNTLLVSCSANLGKCAIISKELITNQTFIGLVPNKTVNVEYLFYKMSFEESRLNEMATGTTISYLSREQFEKYEITTSPTKEEQSAIAKVLSSMDKEIETLNTKLEKYRNLKTAMMQQLLTGKIRLG